MKLTNEVKLGILFTLTLICVVIFAWLMGAANPFKRTVEFYVTYNFAGGIDIGSPVRVAGIKVGQVEKIKFFVLYKQPSAAVVGTPTVAGPAAGTPAVGTPSNEVLTPVQLKISVSKEVRDGIRRDSKFYINLAGIIGERYVEITPGTLNQPRIEPGEIVRGIDPPRIDQLISQSFDLAGKVKSILDKNEGDITKSIKLLYELSAYINKSLNQLERTQAFKVNFGQLVENLIQITNDVKTITVKTNTPEGKKTLELLYQLLWRLEPLNQEAVTKFLKKDGMRVKLF